MKFVLSLLLATTPSLPAQELPPSSCVDASDTMEAAAQTLRSRYVLPDIGSEAADRIDGRIAKGEYASVCGNPDVIARSLTQAVRFILPDNHLRIAAGPPQPTEPPADAPAAALADNLGIAEVARLSGGIGYLRISGWGPIGWVEPRLASAVALLRDATGIIIDVRGNGGGDGNSMILLLRSFLPEGAPETQIGFDRDGNRSDYITPNEPQWDRFPAALPLVILIDAGSASASEALAFSLKEEGRATIVGRRSAGAAYAVFNAVNLPGGYSLYIPEYRAEGRITGTTWEGTGVVPDIWAGAGHEKLMAWEHLRSEAKQEFHSALE